MYAHSHIEKDRFPKVISRQLGKKVSERDSFSAVSGFFASFTVRERADPPSDRWNAAT